MSPEYPRAREPLPAVVAVVVQRVSVPVLHHALLPQVHPHVVVVGGGEPESLSALGAEVQLLARVRRPVLQVQRLHLEALPAELAEMALQGSPKK